MMMALVGAANAEDEVEEEKRLNELAQSQHVVYMPKMVRQFCENSCCSFRYY